MKKKLLVASFVFSCFVLSGVCKAEDEDWKQQLKVGKQEIQEQRKEIKQNSQESRAEEKKIREQIKAARDAGDMETVAKLREQLRATHRENVQQMQQDKKDLKADKMDLKQDVRQAKKEGKLPNKKPVIDRDNNPPGPKGGPGTNWENKPGPRGGPGAGPNRAPKGGAGRR